jgi:hypothetical protein
MHEIEPHYGWEKYYKAQDDKLSPFYGTHYNLNEYSTTIYGYYIHPLWDDIGSETLFVKVLYVDYKNSVAIIELFGEWNDALHNDVMFLKRNLIDYMTKRDIKYFILLGENVMNFHGSDDCYYEEWFEDAEDGWIATINFRYFVLDEWKKFGIATYLLSGEFLDMDNWRTLHPNKLFEFVNEKVNRLLN